MLFGGGVRIFVIAFMTVEIVMKALPLLKTAHYAIDLIFCLQKQGAVLISWIMLSEVHAPAQTKKTHLSVLHLIADTYGESSTCD